MKNNCGCESKSLQRSEDLSAFGREPARNNGENSGSHTFYLLFLELIVPADMLGIASRLITVNLLVIRGKIVGGGTRRPQPCLSFRLMRSLGVSTTTSWIPVEHEGCEILSGIYRIH